MGTSFSEARSKLCQAKGLTEAELNECQEKGRWSPLFDLPNVAVHASLLPNGKVLHWGRRQNPWKGPDSLDPDVACLDEKFTKAFLWTPFPDGPNGEGQYGTSQAIEDEHQPRYDNRRQRKTNVTANLFCAGHTLLPSGNLLVAGGHRSDGFGIEQACIYDYKAERFVTQKLMNNGRWYPTVLSLPDSRVLVISGSDNGAQNPNIATIPQIFSADSLLKSENTWTEVADPIPHDLMLDLFPRMHIDPKNGNPFMVGPIQKSWYLELKNENGEDIVGEKGVLGRWKYADTQRRAGIRDYAPSVMYDTGKILYTGGGTGDDKGSGNLTEFIDLNDEKPCWSKQPAIKMIHPRKQFNATILPNGQVLVNGGTKGFGFNNLADEHIIYESEMLNPSQEPKKWIPMASEARSRCYHSVTLLLPDGRLFSAGSGEYGDCQLKDCHKDAQIFEPPYLFQEGPRPRIVSAPDVVNYGGSFDIKIADDEVIGKVSLVRLGSITHCRNMSQQLVFLERDESQGPSVFLAPKNSNIAPPGPYMLFVLTTKGVPSVAKIVSVQEPATVLAAISTLPSRIAGVAQEAIVAATSVLSSQREEEEVDPLTTVQPSILEHDEKITKEQNRLHVTIGLTPLCPYGLGPCWGGAYQGLQAIKEVSVVRPVPNHTDCTAFVYLKEDMIPDIDKWRAEFETVANKNYVWRGIETTLQGKVIKSGTESDELMLIDTKEGPDVKLASFQQTSQLKWDIKKKAPRPITEAEAGAYKALLAVFVDQPSGFQVDVTGTIQKSGDDKFSLDVRSFVLDTAA